jgi:hypothetical protein
MQHLKDLKIRFSHWRANKLTLAEPVPNKLWQEVKRALKHIAPSLLCRELGITHHQMQLYCNLTRQPIESKGHRAKFIEIAPENKNPISSHLNNATVTTLAGLEKYEVLVTINNHLITIKLPSNNLLSLLSDLKEAL